MGYEHEIFLSYRRTSTAGLWVRNHFRPLLQARLDEIAPTEVRIFCDQDMQEGVNLPEALKHHIRNSGLLLAVWSADYFRSAWCMTEWQSFRNREKMLNLFTEQGPQGLIYPLRYADGKYFHADAKLALCRKDFSQLNYPHEAFHNSSKYLDFDDLVKEVATDLAVRLTSLPVWRADFPIIEVSAMPQPHLTRPII